MLAEICGKISSSGTNLRESLEDNLTGNIFGTLRYMSYEKGLKPMLEHSIGNELANQITISQWGHLMEFWPYHKDGELDAIIYLPGFTIGIEVKYKSGLSSEDEDDMKEQKDCETSKQQLSRESRIIKEISESNNTKAVLLFIAQNYEGEKIIRETKERNIIAEEVVLEFISWESITDIIKNLKDNSIMSYYEKLMLQDLYNLLVKKGLEGFMKFELHNKDIKINTNEYFNFA